MYIDYKAFDRDWIVPRFEFGYGLSYTRFSYSALDITPLNTSSPLSHFPDPDVPIIQSGHPELWGDIFNISCSVANVGSVAGAEIAQLYLGITMAPIRQLRGFEKVFIQPNETREVSFLLTRRDVSVWDVVAQEWKVQVGESVGVWVRGSSRDLRLNGTVL